MVRCAITQNNTDYDDMVVLRMILMMVLMAVVTMVMLPTSSWACVDTGHYIFNASLKSVSCK